MQHHRIRTDDHIIANFNRPQNPATWSHVNPVADDWHNRIFPTPTDRDALPNHAIVPDHSAFMNYQPYTPVGKFGALANLNGRRNHGIGQQILHDVDQPW